MPERNYTRRTVLGGLLGAGALVVTAGAAYSPDGTDAERTASGEVASPEPSDHSEPSEPAVAVGGEDEADETSAEAEADEPVALHETLCTCPVCMGGRGPGFGGP